MEHTITKKTQTRGNVLITRRDITNITLGIFGFFIGRVVIFQVLNPIAISYLSVYLGAGPIFYVICLFTTLGLATKFHSIYLAKYLVCIGLILLANLFLTRKKFKTDVFQKASIGAVATAASGFIFLIFSGFSFYIVLLTAVECILAYSFTFILKKSADVMTGLNRKKILSTEEIISLSVLLGAIVAGSADIYIGFVSLRYFFCTLVLLIVGYKGGSALGAMSGVLLGLMLNIVGYFDFSYSTILAVGGISSGILREQGKKVAIISYFAATILTTIFVDPTLISGEYILSILLGVLTFALIKDDFYFSINKSINPIIDNSEEYIARVREVTSHKLNSFASSFGKLSQSLNQQSEKRTGLDQNDISKIVEDIYFKCCKNCELANLCWKNDSYTTYQNIFSILNVIEKNGGLNIDDISPAFKKTCIHLQDFTNGIVRLYDINKVNLTWHNNLVESREIVSEQLYGVANIIKDLSDDLDLYINFNEDLEQGIISEFNRNDIEVESVIVLENKQDKFEVTITHKACGDKKKCVLDMVPIVSKVIGKKMTVLDKNCLIKKGVCHLSLVEEKKFRFSSSVAKKVKSDHGVSGDSYSFMELKNGEYLLALSDGMGSGKRARDESTMAIGLLEDLIDTGFDKDLSIKMINSALVLKNDEEFFSTLDMCTINMYTGVAEFIKIGASITFLIRDGNVQTISSSNLPIGILKNVEPEITKRQLKTGDIIVMVTDGLIELNNAEHDKSRWIIDALNSFDGVNPEDIADYVIDKACKFSGNIIADDMTVLATRIWERR